ncbi:MAG: nucleotidyltransferase domain-containing protein [Armatimonadota bacterium]|nr:nucleotidyltransferase domain-containing protein [bacterium]MDW8321491.1 nucleotidyltransferase domain-containing protein [Armatimonadota bacterium]
MRVGPLKVDKRKLRCLCRKWRIVRLEVFGSVLREDFHSASDIDLLVTFAPDARWSLMQLYEAEQEFTALFGRQVELVPRSGIERSANYIRRQAILESAEVIYAA